MHGDPGRGVALWAFRGQRHGPWLENQGTPVRLMFESVHP